MYVSKWEVCTSKELFNPKWFIPPPSPRDEKKTASPTLSLSWQVQGKSVEISI